MAIIVNKKIGNTSVSYNPTFYKQAVKDYQDGNYRKLHALMESAERDSHVSGCLIGRRAGFLREWRVTPLSESAADKKVAQLVESVFMGINMRDLFEDVHEARLKKYAVIDLTWDIIANKQVITKAQKIEQKYFRYDPKDNVLKIDFDKTLNEILEDSALVCESNRMPLLLPVLREFILKEFGIESWASFLETFGEAFIIGKYPPGSSKETIDELKQGIDALAGSARGVMPDTSNVEFKETQRHTGDHKDFTTRADQGIAISLLGHANAVEQSPGLQVGDNTSSYKVRREIALGDIFYIEEQIYRLVRMIVDRNEGNGRYPIFSIDKSEPIDVRERLDVLQFAWDTGYEINPTEIAKLGLFMYPNQPSLKKEVVNLLD